MRHNSPQVGFNNNVRHRGKIFHIQTEDSGVRHPHIITHLFADGGRILKSTKTSYAEFIEADDLSQKVRGLMREQHKAMFIALRAGTFDDLLGDDVQERDDGSAGPPKAPSLVGATEFAKAGSADTAERAASSSNEASRGGGVDRSREIPAPPMEPASALADSPSIDLDVPDPGGAMGSVSPPGEHGAGAPPRPESEPPTLRAPTDSKLRAPPSSPPTARRSGTGSGRTLSAVGIPAIRPLTRPGADPPSAESRRTESRRLPSRPPISDSLDRDLELLVRTTGAAPGPQRNLPPPPSTFLKGPESRPNRSFTPKATPVAMAAHEPPDAAPKGGYAASRPASIFGHSRPEGASIFGDELISEKSLDEVILSYLAEDLDPPPKK